MEAKEEMEARRELGNAISLVGNSVDHRGSMTGVKDQKYCGSCWAHAGNSVLEGTLNIFGGGTPRLSEQMPVDCATDNSANRNHFDA